MDTYASDPSDPEIDPEFGSDQAYAYPGLPVPSVDNGHHDSGISPRGLIIDPRLFEPREKAEGVSTQSGINELTGEVPADTEASAGSEGEGGVEVAVPEMEDEDKALTAKPRRSPKKASSSESKKKVSHARKVSTLVQREPSWKVG